VSAETIAAYPHELIVFPGRRRDDQADFNRSGIGSAKLYPWERLCSNIKEEKT
jgi:hypothetical protein